MNKVGLTLLALLIASCGENKEVSKEKKQTEQKIYTPKFYGYPDLPQNDSLITSIGAGKVILGQDLNQIDLEYDSVQNIKMTEDGIEWPGKKIYLSHDEWIIAFTNNSVNQITSIRTNSTLFKTKEGNKIGMNIKDLKSCDSLGIDNEDKALILFKDGVEIKIDKLNENSLFRSKTPRPDLLNKNAKVAEFLIKCGDC